MKNANGGTGKGQKKKWSLEEEDALRKGVGRYGQGKWRAIQQDPEFRDILSCRSNVDLKDKWRNITNNRPKGELPAAAQVAPKRRRNRQVHVKEEELEDEPEEEEEEEEEPWSSSPEPSTRRLRSQGVVARLSKLDPQAAVLKAKALDAARKAAHQIAIAETAARAAEMAARESAEADAENEQAQMTLRLLTTGGRLIKC